MYKLLLPNKQLVTIDNAVAYIEKNFVFAGKLQRIIAKAAKGDIPTMIRFTGTTSGNAFNPFGGFGNANLTMAVGNLPTEKVSEILNALLVQGYYDFSNMEFQKVEKLTDIKVDNGASLPYFLEADNMYNNEVNGVFGSKAVDNLPVDFCAPFGARGCGSFCGGGFNVEEAKNRYADYEDDGYDEEDDGYDATDEDDDEEYDPDNLQ